MNDEFGMNLGGDDYQADADNLVMNLTDVNENGGGFEVLPAGVYGAIIENVEFKISTNGGNPMLAWQFSVTDAPYENRKLFYHTVLNKDLGVANLKKILTRVCAGHVDLTNFQPKTFAEEGIACGLACQLKVKIKPYQGEQRNNVAEVLAPADGGSFIDGM